MSEKILGFYKFSKAEIQIKITEELLENYKAINVALTDELRIGSQTAHHRTAIRPIDGCQLSRLRLRANDRRKRQENDAAPVELGSKVFSPDS